MVVARLINLTGGFFRCRLYLSVQNLCLLLNLQLEGIQSGDMYLGTCVFKLFYPCTVNGVFLAKLDVLVHRPLQLFEFAGGEQLFGISKGNVIVICKALIPNGNALFNLLHGVGKLAVKVFHIGIGVVKQSLLHIFHALRPICGVTLSGHRPHRPLLCRVAEGCGFAQKRRGRGLP